MIASYLFQHRLYIKDSYELTYTVSSDLYSPYTHVYVEEKLYSPAEGNIGNSYKGFDHLAHYR